MIALEFSVAMNSRNGASLGDLGVMVYRLVVLIR